MTEILDTFKKNSFECLFLVYILIQPIIDIITSVSILVLNQSLTIGTIIRFLMMMVAIIYLLLNSKRQMINSKYIVYLCLLGLFFILQFLMNWSIKSPFQPSSELTFLIKISYFTLMFFTYLVVMKNLSRTYTNWAKLVKVFVYFSMSIVSLSMVVAAITDTAFNSYQYSKIGHKGWFFAANEIGALLSICFPIVLLFSIQHTNSFKKWYIWITPLFMIYSLFALGTKVGFGAIILTIFVSIFMSIYEFIRGRKTTRLIHRSALIIQLVIMFAVVIYTPVSPIVKNTSIHLGMIEDRDRIDNENEDIENQQNSENEDKVQQLILSDRDHYLNMHKEYFRNAPLIQKLLGMGYGGNYVEQPKLIEMDFYDLFFSLGVLGFVLYLFPFAYFTFRISRMILLNIRTQLTLEHSLVGTGILLGLGIAFTAGHVITAPGVSIYLAITLGYLVVSLNMRNHET
jgi:hypothetical protein